MKGFALFVVLLCGGLLIYMTADFPAWGDPKSPASTHVSTYYIEESYVQTATPNVVTTVLGDYRGYDTMFETAVVFTAGLACFFLLGSYRRHESDLCLYRHLHTGVVLKFKGACPKPKDSSCFERVDPNWTPYDFIVSGASKLLIPFIQIFGLYVVAHGHYSPGGGFQGGVILAASFLLLGLSHNLRIMNRRFDHRSLAVTSALGVMVYSGVGLVCLGMGFNFLDYAGLADLLHVPFVTARSLGVLFVEIGVTLTVMSTMIIIYNNVASAGSYDEGL